jgi:hypothetical protein
MPFEIDRALYARMYGPTVGDRVRLGDTNLLVEVEQDYASPGDETLWGFGNPDRYGKLLDGLNGIHLPQWSGDARQAGQHCAPSTYSFSGHQALTRRAARTGRTST